MSTSAVLLPSLLDRLTDPTSLGSAAVPGYTLNQLIEAVRRDVEELLNARRPTEPDLDGYPELRRSVYAFGVPELVSRQAATATEIQAIGRLLTEALTAHEPRLREVRAVPISTPGSIERTLRFRIEGRIRVEPSPSIRFETVLELATGATAVRTAG